MNMLVSFYAKRIEELSDAFEGMGSFVNDELRVRIKDKIQQLNQSIRDEYEKAITERVVGMIGYDGAYLLACPIGEDGEEGVAIWLVDENYAVTVMRDELVIAHSSEDIGDEILYKMGRYDE